MDYDVGIIGGGPGGYSAALRVAALGGRVALIEKERLGGVCLNWGCIPTKHLLGLTCVVDEARRSASRGLEIEVGSPDRARISSGTEAVVGRLRKSLERLLEKSGVECIRGEGSVDTDLAVRVNGKTRIAAKSIILATGSRPAALPEGIVRGRGYWTSREALGLDSIPGTLLVVGGGAVGCELAAIYSALGSRVTVVEAMEEIIPFMDRDVGAELRKHLKLAGITLHVGSSLVSVDAAGVAVVRTPKGNITVHAEAVLAAVGRVPEVPALPGGVIEMEGKSVRVGSDMRTANPALFAVGDVTGKAMLAHLATAQARVAAANAMGGDERMDYSAVPICIFTRPEVASVGMGEEEARASGHSVKVGRAEYWETGLAHASGELAGFARVICDEKSGTVLGARIIGARATDLIVEMAVAVKLGLRASDLAGVVHPHPTYSEVIAGALERIG